MCGRFPPIGSKQAKEHRVPLGSDTLSHLGGFKGSQMMHYFPAPVVVASNQLSDCCSQKNGGGCHGTRFQIHLQRLGADNTPIT